MPNVFSRSMRSLGTDRGNRWLVGWLAVTGLLGCWGAWFCLSQVPVYAVTQTARLEVVSAAHPVATPVAGRIVATRLVVGQGVQEGEVLVELDVTAQRLQHEEERTRLAALTGQLEALRKEILVEEEAQRAERHAARVTLDEARARHREAEVAARTAAEEAELYTRLQARGLAAQLDLMRTKAEVQKRHTAVETLRLAISRLDGEQRVKQSDRAARLERFKRDVRRLEGDMATAVATLERLGHEIDKHRIRAPIAGQLGEVAELRIGTVVRAGDTLGAVLPPSTLKVVAHFPPPVALGRLQPGQPARLRLTGFPWTQYGSVPATVASVAHEVRDSQIRVELSVPQDLSFPIPLQHGLPGSVEVEIERVAPVTLVLRIAGKRLGASQFTSTTRGSAGGAR